MGFINIVLFGAGAIAREHVRVIRTLQEKHGQQDLFLAGVYAPRLEAAEAFAAEFNLPSATSDPHRYLDDPGIDVVIVCSPSASHVPQTRAALEAGKHVLCEIPLALSLGEAIALRDLADHRRQLLMVAHTLRFHPSLRAVQEEIGEGRLHPAAIVARNLFLRRSNVGWTGHRRSWTDNLLWHHGGHVVDTCLWLLGAERAEVASQLSLPHLPLDAGIVLRTPDGVLATIALSYNSQVSAHDYTVIGEEQTLVVSPGADTDADPLLAQDDAFFAALRTGDPAPVDVNAILPALKVLQRVADDGGLGLSTEERVLLDS